MNAVILIGGLGTRLRPLTCNTPKAMVPILNRPFLEHLLVYLQRHGVEEVVLAMGYLPAPIKSHLGDGSSLGLKLHYVVEDTPLGTAGAVKNAGALLDSPFLVFNGDILTEIDISEMVRRHYETRPKVSIALTPVDDPSAYGVVETGPGGRVRRFIEKPKRGTATTNMINAGIYILEPEVLNDIPTGTFYMFENGVFPKLLERGDAMLSYPSSAYWIDIGTPEKYIKVNHDLLREHYDGVHAADGSQVHPSVEFEGPVIIGAGSVIGEAAHIVGPTVIGTGCRVAPGAGIEAAILWEGALVEDRAFIKQSVVGQGSRVLKGARVLENCILGDGVTIAEEATLAPGTKVWPGMCFKPGS